MPNAKAVTRLEVKKELDRILSSKSFVRSPILSRFLRFIVEKTLDGQANQIKEYSVGTAVLFKPQGFNPQTDPAVRIHAIRLRKLLNEYYDDVHLDGSVRIFLQKGSYTPVFLQVGKLQRSMVTLNLRTKLCSARIGRTNPFAWSLSTDSSSIRTWIFRWMVFADFSVRNYPFSRISG
jgi:hypothetical protein